MLARAYLLSAFNGSQTIIGALYDPKEGALAVGTDDIVFRSMNGYDWTISNECAFTGGDCQNFGDTILLTGRYLSKSTDDGQSWNSQEVWYVGSYYGTLDTLANFQVGGSHFTSLDSGLAFLTMGVTVGTTNGGLTWDSVDQNPGFGTVAWHGMAGCGSDGSGMDIGVTSDGGTKCDQLQNIQRQNFSISKRLSVCEFACRSIRSRFAVQLCACRVRRYRYKRGEQCLIHGHTDLLRTTDGGASWFPLTSLPTFNPHSVFFRTRMLGYLGGDSGKYFRTDDGGEHWEAFQLQTNNPINIEFLNDTLGFASGTSHNGDNHLNFYTTNGGASWEPDTVRFPPYDGGGYPLSGHVFLNSKTLFAMDEGNLFIRSWPPGSIPASVQNNLGWNPGDFLWIETYPNPAGDHIHVDLSGMWSQPGATLSADLLDMLGKKVMDLSSLANLGNNGSTSDFVFDVSTLPAGVYMLRYSLGGYSFARPVVILH